MSKVSLVPFGDRAVRASRPAGADARALFETLRAIAGVVDVVVTEEHVAVTGEFERAAVARALREIATTTATATATATATTTATTTTTATATATATPTPTPTSALHVVRVRYDGEDLDALAKILSLSIHEIIRRHSAPIYDVKMIGFLPGFAYLGPTDPTIRVPRRDVPRIRVPAGAVAMAAEYTGMYPFASPGGWHVLGHAFDFVAFDPVRGSRFALGDRVRFEAAT